jgi:hypothetical protein
MRYWRSFCLIYGLLGLATAGYCWLIWLAAVFWEALSPVEPSWLVRLTILPVPWGVYLLVLPWQILALLSWTISLIWSMRHWYEPRAWVAPVAHIAWLLVALFWHGVGALYDFVTIAYALG